VKVGATDPTFTLSFVRRKPIGSSPESHAIVLSELILWDIWIKKCESVEGIDGLWTGPFPFILTQVWCCFGHGYPQIMQFVVYRCLLCQLNINAQWPYSQNPRHLFSRAAQHAGERRRCDGGGAFLACWRRKRPSGLDLLSYFALRKGSGPGTISMAVVVIVR
jgi:hypothetical protein